MKKQCRKYDLLVSPVFITGLIILFLNDHLFKYAFPNWITGKLSDFIGLFLFGLFWIVLIPKFKGTCLIVIGLGFVYWKFPLSNSFINSLNNLVPITIDRTVDFSDLFALVMLPVSSKFFERYDYKFSRLKLIHLLPGLLIFSATSYVHPMVADSDKLVIVKITDKDYSFNIRNEDYQEFLDNYFILNDSNSTAYFNRVEMTNDTLFIDYRFKVYFPLDSLNTDYFYANAKFLEQKRGKNKITFDLISAEATVRKDNVNKDLKGLLSGLKHHLKYIAEVYQN